MSNVTALPFDLPSAPEPTARVAGRPAPVMLYESPLATVYQGHAEDLMPVLPTESVDLIVTDPPYGVAWQSRRRKETFEQLANDGAGDRDVIRGVMEHCVRIVRQHRHLYCFGPSDALEGLKVSEIVPLIWDKGTLGSGDVTSAWGPAHEPISFCVSKHRHAGDKGKSSVPTRMRKGSVLSYTRPTGRNVRHPSEKPWELIRELIESSSKQGELVLDPFGGSGSTAVAAILSGRRAMTIELDPKYAAMIVQRVQAAEALVAQLSAI